MTKLNIPLSALIEYLQLAQQNYSDGDPIIQVLEDDQSDGVRMDAGINLFPNMLSDLSHYQVGGA